MLVLVTRPVAQAEATAAALRALGHEPLLDPMLVIEPLPLPDLATEGVAAVVLTSANAVAALPDAFRRLPVFAIGRASAAAAGAAGCRDVRAGPDDGAALARLVRDALPTGNGDVVLHLAAEEVREGLEAGLREAGFAYRRVAAYRAAPSPGLAPATHGALEAGTLGAVLLFSPRTAAVFAGHVLAAGLGDGLRGAIAACLSRAVADEAATPGLPWRAVRVAAARDQTALLDLLRDRSLQASC